MYRPDLSPSNPAARQQSSGPGGPGLPPSSSSTLTEPPRLAGRELGPVPQERLLNPVPTQPHQALPCDRRLLSRDRFTAVIAPWMNKFDSGKARELERCSDAAAFPEKLWATLGEQLRKAPRLRLEPCATFVQPAGILVGTAPNRYELVSLPSLTPGTWEFFLPYCNNRSDSNKLCDNRNLCLTADKKRFVALPANGALIYEIAPENILQEPTLCHPGQPVLKALWSPCGQLLHTQTNVSDSVWSRTDSGHWKEVIKETGQAGGFSTNYSIFSPDSRSFILCAGASPISALSWWCQPDGNWTREPVPLRSYQCADGRARVFQRSVFSPDSRTLALRPEDDSHVEIWHRSEQGEWAQEACVPLDFQDGDPLRPQQKYKPFKPASQDFQDMVFNNYGQLALASIVRTVKNRNPDTKFSERSSRADYVEYIRQRDRHIGVAIWHPSRDGWQKQVQIVVLRKDCPDHRSDFELTILRLSFSSDGRILVADDDCRQVHAWSLLPCCAPTAPSH